MVYKMKRKNLYVSSGLLERQCVHSIPTYI